MMDMMYELGISVRGTTYSIDCFHYLDWNRLLNKSEYNHPKTPKF